MSLYTKVLISIAKIPKTGLLEQRESMFLFYFNIVPKLLPTPKKLYS